MGGTFPVLDSDRTVRIVIDDLSAGWSTRSFPHLIDERALYVADNVVFNRDGLISKRPGNVAYGGGSGATGTGQPIMSLGRFYFGTPQVGQLIAHSGGVLFRGNDATGAFTQIGAGLSTTTPAAFTQMYDPDMMVGGSATPATVLFVADGKNVPHIFDGVSYVPVQTGTSGGSNFLPNGRAGNPLTPAYVTNWGEHLVYAGQPDEPTGLYISDALRPERFNGYPLLDSAGSAYTAYFPAARDGTLGVITGIYSVGPYLVIFFTSGIVTAYNTGTYGAFQYIFSTISRSTGCPAPRSIVPFEGFLVFFGGDRFYATDGQSVVALPDEIPSVYATSSQSAFPSEMQQKTSVVGVRRGQQYWAAYDNVGTGRNSSIVVFDQSANGGWTYGAQSGGAWSRWPTGMPLSCGLECRGPGDANQLFWGSSVGDRIAQHDVGGYADFGAPIAMEIRGKAFFLDKPIWPKKLVGLYLVGAFPTQGQQYTDVVVGYVVTDAETDYAPPVMIGVNPSGAAYGTLHYGSFTYGASTQIIQATGKTYTAQPSIGRSVQPGMTESSINAFNLIGFVMEVIVDEPAP